MQIICNGPGTCVPICVAAFALRVRRCWLGVTPPAIVHRFPACWCAQVLFLSRCRIVFVESFCRVRSLSLSGKLLYPFADRFVVRTCVVLIVVWVWSCSTLFLPFPGPVASIDPVATAGRVPAQPVLMCKPSAAVGGSGAACCAEEVMTGPEKCPIVKRSRLPSAPQLHRCS